MSKPVKILGPFNALIFDQDGTLIEAEALHCNCWCQIASAHGSTFDEQTFSSFAGKGDPAIATYMAPQTSLSAEELVALKRELYSQHLELIPLMRGAKELLQQAHEAGFRLALATISPAEETLRVIRALELEQYFTAIVHRESKVPGRPKESVQAKPAPDIYLAAAELLQVDPEQCCAFEDSFTGMNAAREAGMSVVVIPTPYSEHAYFTRADAVAASLDQISVDRQQMVTVELAPVSAAPVRQAVLPTPLQSEVTTLILAGGRGTRLKSLAQHRPKALATINGEPFLALQMRQLRRFGLRRFVLCVGHQRQMIMDHFGRGEKWQLSIEYAIEDQALGTAGALRNASPLLQGEQSFLLLNGDTFLELDPRALIDWHDQHGGLGTLCVQRVTDATGKGVVELGEDGRLLSFNEKSCPGASGLINAGAYLFSSAILDHIPGDRAISLENEVLPDLLRDGHRFNGYRTDGLFIDIGTPSDYLRAQQELKKYGRG